ncbi:MAG: glutamate cyclase domain-containing protein, partial [Armatimonadota bacterium]
RLHAAGAALVNEPMPLAAARFLHTVVRPQSQVFILTGVYDPISLPFGETDGPPGVASLARALDIGLEAKPVVLCEEQVMPSIELTCVAAGLLPVRDAEHAVKKAHAVLLIPFPITTPESSREQADALVSRHAPSAVVSVERIAGNRKGRHHYAVGGAIMHEAYLEAVAEAAIARRIPTVGVGDGGNEIGMGSMFDQVQEIVPYGRVCQCDCGSGIACATPADVLVVANTSNLGAYGIAACLGMLLGNPALMHDRVMEHRLLDAVAAARCMDGGFISPSVDGTGDSSLAIVELLHRVVQFACA